MAAIKKFGYAAIFTDNFKETLSFYVDGLGFSVDWSDHKKMAMLKSNDFDLLIHPAKGKKFDGESAFHLHLEVDDVDGFHEKLKKAKIKVPKAPKTMSWGMRSFHAKDPNGIEWEFYQKVDGK
jgi:uncharacterized glyoxalase superfamily protein PhnB